MLKKATMLAAAITLGGCATQTFYINQPTDGAPTTDVSQHFFVSGIGQQKTANAAEICGGVEKIAQIETETTFLNGFLSLITYGIYTPRDARVYCKP